jgi:hypothetical protein
MACVGTVYMGVGLKNVLRFFFVMTFITAKIYPHEELRSLDLFKRSLQELRYLTPVIVLTVFILQCKYVFTMRCIATKNYCTHR